jgi:hypothetical protein
MTTEIQKFKNALSKRFFKTSKNSCYSYANMIPSTYRTENGDLILTGNISVTIFGGSNTPTGDLGCVSMELQGKVKPYRCRTVIDRPVMKNVFVAKDAKHAVAEYDRWSNEIFAKRKEWRKII